MSTTARTNRSGSYLLAAVAGSGLATRVIPDLLELGDAVLVPVGLVVSAWVLEWSLVNWVMSWVLLGAVVFQLAPLIFPRNYAEWAHGVPNRLLFAAGSVGVGVFLERHLQAWTGLGTTPFPAPIEYLPVVFLLVALATPVVRFVPPVAVDSGLIYSFGTSEYAVQKPTTVSFTSQYLLAVAVVGVILTELAMLFPLPELLVAGFVVSDGVRGRVLGARPPSRRDFAERLLASVTIIWTGLRGAVWLLYSIAGLLFAILFTVFVYRKVRHSLLGWGTLEESVFILGAVATMTLLVVVHCVRLTERIPLEAGAMEWGPNTRVIDPDGEFLRRRARIPGCLIPAGILLACIFYAMPEGEASSPGPLDHLLLTRPLAAVTLGAALVGIVTLIRPQWIPSLPYSDYHVAVLSLSCFVGIGMGAGSHRINPVHGTALLVLTAGYVTAAPFLGYELLTEGTERYDTLDNLVSGVYKGAVYFVLATLGMIIGLVVLRALGMTTPKGEPLNDIETLLTSLWIIVAAPMAGGAGIRLLLLPFYLPAFVKRSVA